MIDCDKVDERKDFEESCEQEERRDKKGKKNRGVKTFHSLRVLWLVHALTSAAIKLRFPTQESKSDF